MFGYVFPAMQRLNETEQERFRSVYCGLCHTMGRRCGAVTRLFLNYDFTFLAMLLEEEHCTACQKRCVVHPFRKRTCLCQGKGLDTAADLSVVLLWWQIQDGIADHSLIRGLKYRIASLFLHRAYGRAKAGQPEFDAATQKHLQELSILEKAHCPSLDEPADTFARLLAGASEAAGDPLKKRILREILYHLGRWIYLVDASDDLKEDVRHGQYNPLPLRYGFSGDKLPPEAKTELAMTLDDSIRSMAAAFELWHWGDYETILQSTFYDGLYGIGHAVLNGTFHARRTKLRRTKEET